MKNIIKISAIVTICIFSGITTSRADIIINNSFSDMTLNGTTATSGDAWVTGTGVSMLNSGILTSRNGYNFGILGNLSTTNNLTINQNLNIDRSNLHGFYVDFQLTETYELTLVRVLSKHLQNTGIAQGFSSDLNVDIERIGGSTVASDKKNINYDGSSDDYITVDITPTETLTPGDYRLSIGMNNLSIGGGAYASYDSVLVLGDVVPEPTVVSLLGLSGGIMIIGRRLRKRKDPEA